MSRHVARVHAFNLIFQFPFHSEWETSLLQEEIKHYMTDMLNLRELLLSSTPNTGERIFIDKLVSGTFANLPQVDALIDKNLKNWERHRIAKIDLALLRLAIYEIKYASSRMDFAVIINEAIRMAKTYGTDESAAFINGLLGEVIVEVLEERVFEGG